MTLPYDVARCHAVQDKHGVTVDPCTSCARHVLMIPYSKNTPWFHTEPAFWNGERYVCDKHMEIKNGQ